MKNKNLVILIPLLTLLLSGCLPQVPGIKPTKTQAPQEELPQETPMEGQESGTEELEDMTLEDIQTELQKEEKPVDEELNSIEKEL